MKVNISGTFTSGELNKNRYITIIDDEGEIVVENDWVFAPSKKDLKEFKEYLKRELALFIKSFS